MSISSKRLIGEFIRLVSIDSPSYGEREMGDYLKERLVSLGLSVEEDDAGRRLGGNTGNLLAFLDGDSNLEPLLFCTHMDTVEPSRGKRAVVGEDGLIRSEGNTVLGADDCAGIAAVLEALETIREHGLKHRPIELLFSVAEEVYCRGAKILDFSKLRSREAYVLDLAGPQGAAAIQAPSVLSLTVTIHGRASHAGFAPQDGIHAIKAAADALANLPMGKLGDETTFNIGVISGGNATNIIPDVCTLSGEIRSFSHAKALVTADLIKKQFEASAESFGASIEFSLLTCCMAYRTPTEHPVVRRFETVCRDMELPFTAVSTFGGSDNNILAEHNITGIVLASAMYRCHSCDEYTAAGELASLAELTLRLMTCDTEEKREDQ